MAIIHVDSPSSNLRRGEATYTRAIGRCKCGRQGQLDRGRCLACRQAAERAHPTAPDARVCPLCHKAVFHPKKGQRYHADCAAEMRRRANNKARRDWSARNGGR